MRISKQARRDAKALFRACLVDGRLDEERVRQWVGRVVAAKPRGYLATLLHFQRLVKLDLDRRRARVESAVPLGAELESGLRDKLARRYGPGLMFEFRHDPALLGGLRVQVGSDVYDGSVRGRLNRLAESF